ncbi:PREDICTED: ankyrin repeat domain-containing protein 39 [Nanorana parkeri]|uniref:ankyrin repeat domain-containing protein 39 n=1 Tax=Nanorana parkeri TaxID=125878 RepID=UPI0008547A2A|nr:PREDICTED: ankyrin repeat domain-containing protein 39 [Nanorana parkeri]
MDGHGGSSCHSQGCEGCCMGADGGVRETVQEMDFHRGIWSAALDGDLTRVQRFIDKGTGPNLTDHFGYTALHYSCRNGHLPVCSFLLSVGADSNAQTHGGSTAMHRAAYCGHLQVVQLLLKYGADPMKRDSDGRTVLHKAAEGGQWEMCHFLLHHYKGLSDIQDCRGQTAADLAPSTVADVFSI